MRTEKICTVLVSRCGCQFFTWPPVFVKQIQQRFVLGKGKKKKKARRVILGQHHCLEREVFYVSVPRYQHVYTYYTKSPVWLVSLAVAEKTTAVCSRGLQNRVWLGFSSRFLQVCGLNAQAWLCTSDINSILFGITHCKWLFLPFSMTTHFSYKVYRDYRLLLIFYYQICS